MQIDRETAIDIAYQDCDPERYLHVVENHLGETRWGIVKETVFIDVDTGQHHAFEWEQGATEMQEDEFDEPTEAYPVKPVEVTVTEYHKV